VSPVEVIQSHLDRIECVGQRVNAMVTVMVDTALADAAVTERAVPRRHSAFGLATASA